MKMPIAAIVLIGVLSLTETGQAAQVGAHIAYPLEGSSYTISSAYPILPVSFSVTCKDLEDHSVTWGYGSGANDETLGRATFRGTESVQFLQKFSKGTWVFWVKSDCGESQVKFRVLE